jgi:hypothetical protein
MPRLLYPTINNQVMLRSNPALRLCPVCQMPMNKWEIPTDLAKKPAGGPHWSMTRDGFHLASPSFRRRFDIEGFTGLEFRPLTCGYFDIRPTRWVQVLKHEVPWGDDIPGHPSGLPILLTNHSRHCATCGQYSAIRSYIGTVIAPGQAPVTPLEFVGMDHLAGDGCRQFFAFIVGDAVYSAHRAKAIKGASIYHPALHAGIDCPIP